jgi:hypothetical protein
VVLVERASDYYFDSDPYQLNRRKLVFDATSLKIEYSSNGVAVDDTYREEATSWVSPPTEVEGACSSKQGKLVFTFANTTDVVEYLITELNDPEPSSVIDSCLVGSWTATESSKREIAQWVAANPLTKPSVTTTSESITGGLRAIVERTGRASGRMTDLEQTYESSIRMGNQTISNRTTVIINGSSMGKYSADGNKLTVWNVCSDSTARARVEMNGNVISEMDIDLQGIADMGSVSGIRPDKLTGEALISRTEMPTTWEFGYRCAGGKLEVDAPTMNPNAPAKNSADTRPPWRFTRD